MAMRSLIPSGRRELARREEERPFYSLQREMNRMMDDFFQGYDVDPFRMLEGRFGAFSPSIDVREDEQAFTVEAEVPGIDEKDIDIQVSDSTLTIKGEKKEEKEDQDKDYYCMERSYGSFRRSLRLPEGVDREKVVASFKNGVLTIKLPKSEEVQGKAMKIPITSA